MIIYVLTKKEKKSYLINQEFDEESNTSSVEEIKEKKYPFPSIKEIKKEEIGILPVVEETNLEESSEEEGSDSEEPGEEEELIFYEIN